MLYVVKVSGEIPLKSHRTRPKFEGKLVSNVLEALRRNGLKCIDIKVSEGIIYADCEDGAEKVIKDVFGVHKVCKVVKSVFKDLDDICRLGEELFRDVVSGKKFAVRVRRVGQHSFSSLDVARVVGEILRKYSSGVDLDNPQVEVFIEIRGGEVYFYHECLLGVNGLPVGVEGRVLMLVSGGFDSVVASWLVSKRGVEIDILHYVMGSYENVFRALNVIKKLAMKIYGYSPKLFMVDLSTILSYILRSVRNDYRQVVLRRFMYLVALELARKYGYDAIGTGESLGQASSQTLKNLRVIEESLPEGYRLPILRPLISMDKDEIIKLARSLGTYEDSSKVSELCAIASGPVTTKADLNTLVNESSKVGIEVVNELVTSVRVYNLLNTDIYEILKDLTIELDFIPDNAVIIDVRDKKDFELWHYPKALSIYDVDISELPKDRPVITYCDSGQVSSVWASALRAKGVNAFSFKGGLGRIKSCVSG